MQLAPGQLARPQASLAWPLPHAASIPLASAPQPAWRPADACGTTSSRGRLPRGQCSWSSRAGSSSQRQQRLVPLTATGGGDGGSQGPGGGGGGGGGDDSSSEGDDDELLSLQQAEEMAAAKGVQLPADFVAAAASGGLRKSALLGYLSLQGYLIAGLLSRSFPFIRNRLLRDPRFLFKVFAEVAIDSGCCTVAEVKKRGKDFWAEWEFYCSDLMVGLVLDCTLVSLLAPVAVIGRHPRSAGATGVMKLLARVPSAVFEASTPGRKYKLGARVACLGVKFLEYSLAGMACGLAGQGIANSVMMLKRRMYGASEDDVKIPPLFRTALVWGLFMGVSSNVRYQTVFGLERLVDMTIAKRVPAFAYASTIAIRFANNIVGGEQFIDLARWAGVQ